MQPAYYEDLEEIQNKYWAMLDDAVTNRSSPFRIPVFICAHQDEVDGRIAVSYTHLTLPTNREV